MVKTALVIGLAALVCAPLAGADLQPVDISPAGLSASRPLIATDGKGTVVAVWRQLDGNSWAIRAAVRPKDGEWASQRISDPALATESPALAMDRLGNAVAIWQRSDGGSSVVQAAVLPAGGDWSAPENLSAPADSAYRPAVSAENGHLAAAWVALHNRHTLVVTSSRAVDGHWSPPEPVAGPLGNPGSPAIALDDAGDAVAVWLWSNGVHRVVDAASRTPSGPWTAPTVLSRADRNASRPRLALDGAGDAVAGWVRTDGDWTVPEVDSRKAGGVWDQPVTLANRAGNARELDLDVSGDGHAIASWRQGSPNADLLSASRPSAGSRWGDPSPIAQDWPGIQADVTLDEEGNATAVWSSDDTVSASFKPVGEPWQEDYLLSNYDLYAAAPAVAAYGPKVATAVWLISGDENDRIQSVNYDINTSAQEAGGGDGGDGGDTGEVFQGTKHDDRLVGTPGNDVFYAHGGNDTIIGRGGRDVVYGGSGNDRIVGGAGADRLFGGPGRDRIVGGRGADLIVGGTGRDLILGGSGDDTLLAKEGFRDVVSGGRGLDQYSLDRWLDHARSVESRFG